MRAQGIEVKPVYTAVDVEGLPGYGTELPGVFPYSRGARRGRGACGCVLLLRLLLLLMLYTAPRRRALRDHVQREALDD